MKAKHLFYTLFIFLFHLPLVKMKLILIMFLLYYSILKEERTW